MKKCLLITALLLAFTCKAEKTYLYVTEHAKDSEYLEDRAKELAKRKEVTVLYNPSKAELSKTRADITHVDLTGDPHRTDLSFLKHMPNVTHLNLEGVKATQGHVATFEETTKARKKAKGKWSLLSSKESRAAKAHSKLVAQYGKKSNLNPKDFKGSKIELIYVSDYRVEPTRKALKGVVDPQCIQAVPLGLSKSSIKTLAACGMMDKGMKKNYISRAQTK